MMTVGLHCRLARPGRVAAIADFLDFAKAYGREVWICTREQIANHWYENHLPRGVGNPIKPSSFNGRSTGMAVSTSVSPSSRLSFLGDLSTPRDSQDELDKKMPFKPSTPDSDGDII